MIFVGKVGQGMQNDVVLDCPAQEDNIVSQRPDFSGNLICQGDGNLTVLGPLVDADVPVYQNFPMASFFVLIK